MRAASALLLVFLALPALAQPCDPAAADEVCPDTTDWHRYFPLEVGNQWQYHVNRFFELDYDHGTAIVGTTEIDGESYFLAQRCVKPAFEGLNCGSPFPIRYDEASRTVLRRYIDVDGNPGFDTYSGSDYFAPCPFDAPFGPSQQECVSLEEESTYWISGAYGVGYEGLGDTRKEFDDGLQGSITFVAGLGAVGSTNIDNNIEEDLLYARISGEEIGNPTFAFPTSSEPGAAQPVATRFTAAFPNPARGAMQAQFTLAASQTVTLELIDLLGRRVRETELGSRPAGTHDIRLALGGLRPGLYVLRLRGDAGAEATRRIVVVR